MSKILQVTQPFMILIELIEFRQTSGKTLKLDSVFYTNGSARLELTRNPFRIENLFILSSGFFKFKVKAGENFKDAISSIFSSRNDLKTVNFSTSPNIIFNHALFSLSVFFLGDDENFFFGQGLVEIKEKSTLGLLGTLKSETSNGKVVINDLMFLGHGGASLEFISNLNSEETSIKVLKNSLKLEFPENLPETSDYFTVIAKVSNDANSNDYKHPFSVSLRLIQLKNYSGNNFTGNLIKTGTGPLIFDDLKILSSGWFQLEASSINMTSFITEEGFCIKNKVLYTLISPKSINATVFEDFNLTLQLFGEDKGIYLINPDINQTTSSDFIVKNQVFIENQANQLILTLTPRNAGAFSLGVLIPDSSPHFNSDLTEVKVSRAHIKPEFQDLKIYSENKFALNFRIMKDMLESLPQANNFSVTLELNCIYNNSFPTCETFTYEGNIKVECFNGFLRFENLVVNQPSVFTVALKPEREETFDFNLNHSLQAQTNIQFSMKITSELINLSDIDSKRKFKLEVKSSNFGEPRKNIAFRVSFSENKSKNMKASGLKINQDVSGEKRTNDDGVYEFKDLQIFSSGFFIFSLSYSYQPEVTYETHFFRNYIKRIDLVNPVTAFVNYPVEIPYSLTGDDDNPYLLEANLSIFDRFSKLIRGNSSFLSTSPSGSFHISLPLNKTYYLEVSSDQRSSENPRIEINCFSNTLKVWSSFDHLQVVNDSTPLVFEGFVYGKDEKLRETYHGSYIVTIKDTLRNVFSKTVKTSEGLLNETFFITIPGTYNFSIFTGAELKCSYFKVIRIVATLDYISLNESLLSWPVLTLIDLTASLITHNQELYLNKSDVQLSCSDNSGLLNTSISTSTGQAKFYLYFESPGFVFCNFKAADKIKSFFLEINKDRQLVDDECLIQLNPTTCYKCVLNARLDLEGNCECSSNSKFKINSRSCECLPGFKSVNQFCLTCGFFYDPGEISANFLEDFRTIEIRFDSPANLNMATVEVSQVRADNVFSLPGSLIDFVRSAEWTSSKQFEIKFREPVNGNNGSLILNPSYFQKVPFGDCDDRVKPLVIKLTALNKPLPEFSIVAPSQVSTICSLDSIVVSSYPFNSRFSYIWSSSEAKVQDLLTNQTSADLELSINDLQQPATSLTLTVTDKVFETTSSKTISLKVVPSKTLAVVFPQGQSLSYAGSENLPLKAQVMNSCKESNFQYKWEMKNLALDEDWFSPPASFKSRFANLLILNKTALTLNNDYLFQVTVKSANNVQGSASILVQVLSTPLVLTLNRVSGNVSTQSQFWLKAEVNDPDQPDFNDFTFLWKCFDRLGEECLGNDLKVLLEDKSKNFLDINETRLRNDSFCNFQVEVTRLDPFKIAKAEVQIFFSGKIQGKIIMNRIPEFVNGLDAFILTPGLFLDGQKDLKWMIKPIPAAAVDTSKEFLIIPGGCLKPGKNYMISLSMKKSEDLDENAVSSSVNIYVNSAPRCQKFSSIDTEEGKVLLSAVNCQDQDSDSAIFYQFGFIKNNSEVWLTKKMPFSSIKLRIPEEIQVLAVKVCDSRQSCTVYKSEYSKSRNPRRFLSITQKDFDQDIEDLDEIPAAVVFFSTLIKNITDVDFLLEKLKTYFFSVQIEDSAVDSFFSCLESIFVGKLNKTEFNSSISHGANEFMKKILEVYPKELKVQNFEKLVRVFASLMDSLDERSIDESLKVFSGFAMRNHVFNSSVIHQPSGFGRFRIARDSLVNQNLTSGQINVRFPLDLNVDDRKYVYDLITHSYYKEFPIFDVSLKQVGDQINGLSLYDSSNPHDFQVNSTEGIKIDLRGIFNTSKTYECKFLNETNYWIKNGCRIINKTENQITMLVFHFSIFSIQELNSFSLCSEGFGPLLVIAILILTLVLSLYSLRPSDETLLPYDKKDLFWLIHPVTGIFKDKLVTHKCLQLIHIITWNISFINLVGAFQYYFNGNDEGNDTSSDQYDFSHVKAGIVAFFLNQVLAFPIFYLNAYIVTLSVPNELTEFRELMMSSLKMKKMNLIKLSILICAFIVFGGCIGIFIMTLNYCEILSLFWIYNWIIFAVADCFTFKVLFALVLNNLIEIIPQLDDFQGCNNSQNSLSR